MGIALPQLAPASTDRVSGALVVDGSLRFNGTNQYLSKNFVSSGNRKTWTWSAWVKRHKFGTTNYGLFSYWPGSGNGGFLRFSDDAGGDTFRFVDTGNSLSIVSEEKFRDTGWYHIVIAADTTLATESDRIKRYVNGVRQLANAANTWPSENDDLDINQSGNHYIGRVQSNAYGPVAMSNVYFADGLALGPGYFGYTDPLTNTWRPKKFKAEGTTLNDGTQWSSYISNTSTAGNLFDGDLTTFYGPGGSTETWTPPKPIEVATSVRIYYSSGSASRNFEVNDNGNVVASGTGTKWVDLEFTGSLRKISGTNGWNVGAIEIDGEILVDSTTTNLKFGANGFYLPFDGSAPIGQDQQESPINDGTVWSNFLTSSGSFDLSPTFGFDGIISGSNECRSKSGDTVTFTPPGGINYTSKVEVYNQSLNNQVSLNGGTPIALGSYSTWKTIATGTGTINTMVFNDTNGDKFAFGGIRVDGVVLVDGQIGNSWTPVNFGGSTDITKATGALPIINTVNGGTIARPGVFGSEVSKEYTVTVNNPGSGNKYYLDGALQSSPTLHRGGTYTFDYTAAPSHPLYLSSLPDGKHNSKAYSVQFDGTDDRLAVGTSSDYAFGTGDFAIEMFIYHTDLTGQQTYFSDAHGDNDGIYFYKDGANALSLYDNNNNVFSAGTIELNKWHHIALTRSGGVVRGFIDGTMVAEVLDDHNYTETQYNIGDSHGSSSGEFIGYISNVRVLKGSALYTANFTPPTTTLTNITNTVLLCCQDSAVTTAVVVPSGQSITAAGNPAATNSHNPFLYNNVHGNFGVNTATSNVTKITIPHYASDLYYYCNQHPNMGNTTAMSVVTDLEKADQYAWKCVAAVPLFANKDYSSEINCNTTAKAVASYEGTQAYSSQSNFYVKSLDLGAANARNSTSLAASADFAFGATSNPWTVELWGYRTTNTPNSGYMPLWEINGDSGLGEGWLSFLGSNGSDNYFFYGYGSASHQQLTWSLSPTNRWVHNAFVCDGTYIYIFEDGVCKVRRTISSLSGNPPTFGRNAQIVFGTQNYSGDSANRNFAGQLQDFRIYKGVAKYTASAVGEQAFIPASTNPDILPDSPSGVATKSKLKKITDGAVHFDGTNDNLTITAHSDLDLSSGDFTVEGFVYPQRSQEQSFVTNWNSGGQFQVQMSSSGTLQASWAPYSTGQYAVTGTTPIKLHAWSHFAYTRSGNTFELFLDGKSQGTQTSSANGSTNNNIVLGENGGNGDRDLQGFLSNVRIIKGTALYTSDFIPPSEPLTAVTNTKLLCCQSTTNNPGTASYDDSVLILPMNGANNGTTFTDISPKSHSLTRQGNTKTSTTYSKFYGSSGYFDGSGDYIDMGDSDDWIPQLGWTVEMWVYITGGTGSQRSLLSQSGSGGTNQSFQILIQSTNKFACSIRNNNGNSWADANSNSAIPENQWVHLAVVVESGGTVKLYVDGTAQTETASFSGTGYNTSEEMWIGAQPHPSYPAYFTGYMNDVAMYQTAKYTSNFTPTTTGLLSSPPTAVAAVSPGTLTPNGGAAASNFNPFNTDINTFLGQEGNYCTWNPLRNGATTLSNGNLDVSTTNNARNTFATMGVSSGKWFWEVTINSVANTHYPGIGVNTDLSQELDQQSGGANDPDGYMRLASGLTFNNDDTAQYDTDAIAGDVIGVALDMDAGTISFHRNGRDPGVALSGITGTAVPVVISWTGASCTANFGQKPFQFPPPDGFQPLTSSTVRPDTVIARPNQYVNTMIYSGTNNSGDIDVTSTDTNFTPDLVWVKTRTGGNEHNAVYDSVRGANKRLLPSSGNQQVTTTANDLNAFIPGGFTMNGQNGHIYNNGYTHVAWMWKAGGAPTADNTQTSGAMTANSVSLDGVLQSAYTPSGSPSTYPKRMSVGTKQGFSIVKFVGTGNAETIPHGLSETPTFIIHKFATASSNWSIWTPHLGSNERLTFTSNGTDSSSSFQNTNSSTFNVAVGFNDDTVEMIAYCWHDVPGMFKTGTYKNNASADGPFIELGFKPALFMLKCTGGGTNWRLADNTRDPYNNGSTTAWLKPSTNDTEVNERAVDFLSNGVKIRSTSGGDINQSSNAGNITYIYAAWAEQPAFNLYGAQSNAR